MTKEMQNAHHNAAGTQATRLRKPHDSLSIALLRARETVMTQFRPMLAKHDVSEQQWRVIRLLHENGTLDATDVAKRTFILAPSLTRIIRTLEEKQVLSRQKDGNDGRRMLLKLEPKGEAIIQEILPDHTRIYDQLEQHFGKEWVSDLLQRLDQLITHQA